MKATQSSEWVGLPWQSTVGVPAPSLRRIVVSNPPSVARWTVSDAFIGGDYILGEPMASQSCTVRLGEALVDLIRLSVLTSGVEAGAAACGWAGATAS